MADDVSDPGDPAQRFAEDPLDSRGANLGPEENDDRCLRHDVHEVIEPRGAASRVGLLVFALRAAHEVATRNCPVSRLRDRWTHGHTTRPGVLGAALHLGEFLFVCALCRSWLDHLHGSVSSCLVIIAPAGGRIDDACVFRLGSLFRPRTFLGVNRRWRSDVECPQRAAALRGALVAAHTRGDVT